MTIRNSCTWESVNYAVKLKGDREKESFLIGKAQGGDHLSTILTKNWQQESRKRLKEKLGIHNWFKERALELPLSWILKKIYVFIWKSATQREIPLYIERQIERERGRESLSHGLLSNGCHGKGWVRSFILLLHTDCRGTNPWAHLLLPFSGH